MTQPQYIHAGWLIDGSGGPIKKDVLLTVRDGKFAAIQPYENSVIGDPSQLTDLSFGVILPPFIDCHVHLSMSGTTDPEAREQQLVVDCDVLEPVIKTHIGHHLSHGVLAVRDGGDRNGCVLRYLQSSKTNSTGSLLIKSSGRAWHRQGRYGSLIGRAPEEDSSVAEEYSRQGDAADQVKLVNSGLNSLKEFGRQTPPQFSCEEIRRLVEEAGKRGRKVMVHANGKRAVREALEAGCHSIEHGFFMGRDNLQLMVEKGAVWVPTAYTMKAYSSLLEDGGDLSGAAIARQNLDDQLAQMRLARELGVEIALGTDAGSPGVLHGESLVEELKLFIKAGFSLSEAVCSATSIAARLLGIDEFGEIAIGSPATFLLARGTPAQLPRKFLYLENIYRDGNPSTDYRKNPVKHVTKIR